MRFRLVWHDTDDDNKYTAERGQEYFGDKKSIFRLWLLLKKNGARHVEVFALDGRKLDLEKGSKAMVDYNP